MIDLSDDSLEEREARSRRMDRALRILLPAGFGSIAVGQFIVLFGGPEWAELWPTYVVVIAGLIYALGEAVPFWEVNP